MEIYISLSLLHDAQDFPKRLSAEPSILPDKYDTDTQLTHSYIVISIWLLVLNSFLNQRRVHRVKFGIEGLEA